MMKEYKHIYLDTAPIIYALENVAPYAAAVQEFIFANFRSDALFSTSAITNTEYLVIPYKEQDNDKIKEFEQFKVILKIQVVALGDAIAKKAAQICATYSGIKTIDALHLATAIQSQCDVFLTNDKQLKQVAEINVLLVDEL